MSLTIVGSLEVLMLLVWYVLILLFTRVEKRTTVLQYMSDMTHIIGYYLIVLVILLILNLTIKKTKSSLVFLKRDLICWWNSVMRQLSLSYYNLMIDLEKSRASLLLMQSIAT